MKLNKQCFNRIMASRNVVSRRANDFRKTVSLLLMASFAIGLCSCTSTLKRFGDASAETPENFRTVSAEAGRSLNGTTTPSGKVIRASAVGLNQSAGYVSPVGHTSEVVRNEWSAARFSPAQPRVPLSPVQQGMAQPTMAQLAQQYPDEYLFDGGDRSLPIHYDAYYRRGLDTEDTVVEYTDHTGKRNVKPSNRVAIFAPRFGAVRTVSQPISGVSVSRSFDANSIVQQSGVGTRKKTVAHTQRIPTSGVKMRSRASGINAKAKGIAVQQRLQIVAHSKLAGILEHLQFLSTGRMGTSEEARIASRIQAATHWTRKQFPIVTGGLDAIREVQATFQPQEIVGIDDKHKTKGRLRIVKLADKKSAVSGDIVTFTIRYDNLGDRPLHHIRIIDNLTPRLEYVKDSAESDRAGRLVVQENGEGSLILKYELSQPLKGHTGGVVTFKAKVR